MTFNISIIHQTSDLMFNIQYHVKMSKITLDLQSVPQIMSYSFKLT